MKAALAVENLTKRYGRRMAVEGVGLRVEPGRIVGFLGPNGSGKTTVVRILMGLITATSGRAEILGTVVSRSASRTRADVGYLPGTLRLPENLSGREFLHLLVRLRDGRGSGMVDALAERFSVSLDEPISSMSKGTRQKIGVIQAFMHEPAVLILDEPTSGLDPLVQREFDELLRERVGRGVAVLLSSHILSDVERIADSVAILNEGRLVADGPVRGMAAKVARRLTFEFSNVIDASLLAGCAGVEKVEIDGLSVAVAVTGPETDVLAVAARLGAVGVVSHEPSLDDVFVAVTGGGRAR